MYREFQSETFKRRNLLGLSRRGGRTNCSSTKRIAVDSFVPG